MDDRIIHIKADTDELGYVTAWCGESFVFCAELPEAVTCRKCLEAVVNFATTCAKRLDDLRLCDSGTAQQPTSEQTQEPIR